MISTSRTSTALLFTVPEQCQSLAEEAMEIAYDLTDIPSVESERAVGEWIKQFCRETFGVDVLLTQVAKNRFNAFVEIGDTPEIVFTTHMDTVPFGENQALRTPQWSNDKQLLTARGACDAKGIIAAQLVTVKWLLEQGQTNFGLLFVAGEETTHVGALDARNALADKGIQYLINGEPTDGEIVTAHNGGYKLQLEAFGLSAHSSKPSEGLDAGDRLRILVQAIRDAEQEGDLGTHETLGVTRGNFHKFHVDSPHNVIPPYASASAFFRLTVPTSEFEERVRDLTVRVIEETLESECRNGAASETNYPGALPGQVYRIGSDPSYTGYEAWQTRLDFSSFPTHVVPFGTDLPILDLLASSGSVLVGPGSIKLAHKDNESISVFEMEQGIRSYLELVSHLRQR